ncbi:uncharacterized protein LOC116291883 [Actinia tenebrosa]|uniref:Uncharacterized protein LOC116291883 n=1 Tax=Actinia tenebrosa TaxID=6105 RepID=A0A6P8HGL3_ACTTE|nr:uncharacterized protein LOC116291883 [Actinia tenebrosa]
MAMAASAPSSSIGLFTLNIWFGDFKMKQRMAAIGRTVSDLKPDIITFQEVTTVSLKLLKSQEWFPLYKMVPDKILENQGYFVVILSKFEVVKWRSLPFKNSRMGRNLLIAELKANIQALEDGNKIAGQKISNSRKGSYIYLTIATSHLESMAFTTKEREAQLQQSLQILSEYDDVCLMGDLNLELKVDGEVYLPTPWIDTWLSIPGNSHSNGYTWDPAMNSNAQVSEPNTTKDRFDRVFCKLLNFSVKNMSIIGTEPHDGVHLSDHFGVFTNLTHKERAMTGGPKVVKEARFIRPRGWEKYLNI